MTKKNIIIGAFLTVALSSCYEDKSSFPVNTIDDVVLDIEDADKTIRTGYLEQLDIVPELTKGGNALGDEGFSYLWEINILPKSYEFEVLGTERELHAVITNPISTDNYLLKLTIHDDAENLSYLFTWNVYVETAFLDGLVVSDTHDGQTSDLTLILNDRLTMGYTKSEVIHRNIVESATGQPYQSLLTSLTPFLNGYIDKTHTNYLFAVDSDKRLVRFDCQDYSSVNGKDLVYYYSGETVRGMMSVGSNVSCCSHYLMTSKGVYYGDVNSSDFVTTLNATLSTSAPKDDVFAFKTYDASVDYWGGECGAVWIDDKTGKVTVLNATFQGGSYQELEAGDNPAFPVGDTGVQQVIAAAMTSGNKVPTLLVKERDGDIAIYTVSTVVTTIYDEEWDSSYEETSYRPGQRIVVPSTVGSRIESAVKTVFTDENSVLYIASPTEVTAALYGSGTITDGGTKFTPDAGETITSINVYHQGDYYYSTGLFIDASYNRPRLDLTSRALIVTTQKGDEGFVYVVPMTQLGTGNLDRSKEMKYEGFGRILDVATTGY